MIGYHCAKCLKCLPAFPYNKSGLSGIKPELQFYSKAQTDGEPLLHLETKPKMLTTLFTRMGSLVNISHRVQNSEWHSILLLRANVLIV